MKDLEALTARWRFHVPGMLGAKRNYAVLCPFVDTNEGLSLLLEVRASTLRRQPGEVCFPGGRMEDSEDAITCALRETEEELEIHRAEIQILGQSDFVANPAGFTLQPVLGLVSPEGFSQLHPSPAEVAEAFVVPVTFFRNIPPDLYVYRLTTSGPPDFPYEAVGIPSDYRWSSGQVPVPVWFYQGHAIWGMTARIIQNLLDFPIK